MQQIPKILMHVYQWLLNRYVPNVFGTLWYCKAVVSFVMCTEAHVRPCKHGFIYISIRSVRKLMWMHFLYTFYSKYIYADFTFCSCSQFSNPSVPCSVDHLHLLTNTRMKVALYAMRRWVHLIPQDLTVDTSFIQTWVDKLLDSIKSLNQDRHGFKNYKGEKRAGEGICLLPSDVQKLE